MTNPIDTIDLTLLVRVANELPHLRRKLGRGAVIHTVTVTLNKAHGGADVTIEGVDDDSAFTRAGVIRR